MSDHNKELNDAQSGLAKEKERNARLKSFAENLMREGRKEDRAQLENKEVLLRNADSKIAALELRLKNSIASNQPSFDFSNPDTTTVHQSSNSSLQPFEFTGSCDTYRASPAFSFAAMATPTTHTEEEWQDLQNRLADLGSDYDRLAARSNNWDAEKATLNFQIVSLQTDARQYKLESEKKITELTDELSGEQFANAGWRKQMQDASDKLDDQQTEIEQLHDEIGDAHDLNEQLKADLNAANDTISQLRAQVLNEQTKTADEKQRGDELDSTLDEAIRNADDLTVQLSELARQQEREIAPAGPLPVARPVHPGRPLSNDVETPVSRPQSGDFTSSAQPLSLGAELEAAHDDDEDEDEDDVQLQFSAIQSIDVAPLAPSLPEASTDATTQQNGISAPTSTYKDKLIQTGDDIIPIRIVQNTQYVRTIEQQRVNVPYPIYTPGPPGPIQYLPAPAAVRPDGISAGTQTDAPAQPGTLTTTTQTTGDISPVAPVDNGISAGNQTDVPSQPGTLTVTTQMTGDIPPADPVDTGVDAGVQVDTAPTSADTTFDVIIYRTLDPIRGWIQVYIDLFKIFAALLFHFQLPVDVWKLPIPLFRSQGHIVGAQGLSRPADRAARAQIARPPFWWNFFALLCHLGVYSVVGAALYYMREAQATEAMWTAANDITRTTVFVSRASEMAGVSYPTLSLTEALFGEIGWLADLESMWMRSLNIDTSFPG